MNRPIESAFLNAKLSTMLASPYPPAGEEGGGTAERNSCSLGQFW
jgi:hypothetical protein